ncbi:acyltransferase [Paraburkholderia acidicola]|uniref:Acyltransferase n=1 Tax=Paraburkholderia acidicola TaxID=1912599 RepID=A0A2A4F439_9BURK|nr:acyltransferase [Paraburkholderia acidicola]PCE27420.1 acyltransferase [Paraburkholderia acidicola]
MNLLSHSLSRNGNNFDLVRLCAAIAVVYSHSFLIQSPDGTHDPVAASLGFDGAGSFGVYAFFLLSGMLVTTSFVRQRSALRFVALRIARIWPAVAAGSLFAVFAIGPLFTTLPLSTYFRLHATWANLDNFSTLVLKRGWVLPGVFEYNRFGPDVCAPLWTLPLEVRCYAIVLVTGVAGLLSTNRGIVIAALLGLVVFGLHVHFDPLQIGLRDFAEKPGGYSFWPEPFFMLGMLLVGLRERVRIDGIAALGLIGVFLVFHDTAAAQPLFYLAFVYAVLWVGTTPLLRRWVPRHDYSYGIYLYGFAIQQCVAAVAPQLDHLAALAVAAPLIMVCAMLSWHGVERPALAWCRWHIARRGMSVNGAGGTHNAIASRDTALN